MVPALRGTSAAIAAQNAGRGNASALDRKRHASALDKRRLVRFVLSKGSSAARTSAYTNERLPMASTKLGCRPYSLATLVKWIHLSSDLADRLVALGGGPAISRVELTELDRLAVCTVGDPKLPTFRAWSGLALQEAACIRNRNRPVVAFATTLAGVLCDLDKRRRKMLFC